MVVNSLHIKICAEVQTVHLLWPICKSKGSVHVCFWFGWNLNQRFCLWHWLLLKFSRLHNMKTQNGGRTWLIHFALQKILCHDFIHQKSSKPKTMTHSDFYFSRTCIICRSWLRHRFFRHCINNSYKHLIPLKMRQLHFSLSYWMNCFVEMSSYQKLIHNLQESLLELNPHFNLISSQVNDAHKRNHLR